jgi:hypothetical protein
MNTGCRMQAAQVLFKCHLAFVQAIGSTAHITHVRGKPLSQTHGIRSYVHPFPPSHAMPYQPRPSLSTPLERYRNASKFEKTQPKATRPSIAPTDRSDMEGKNYAPRGIFREMLQPSVKPSTPRVKVSKKVSEIPAQSILYRACPLL